MKPMFTVVVSSAWNTVADKSHMLSNLSGNSADTFPKFFSDYGYALVVIQQTFNSLALYNGPFVKTTFKKNIVNL